MYSLRSDPKALAMSNSRHASRAFCNHQAPSLCLAIGSAAPTLTYKAARCPHQQHGGARQQVQLVELGGVRGALEHVQHALQGQWCPKWRVG